MKAKRQYKQVFYTSFEASRRWFVSSNRPSKGLQNLISKWAEEKKVRVVSISSQPDYFYIKSVCVVYEYIPRVKKSLKENGRA